MESELVRALSQIGLIEADSTSSAAEKIQSMAKTARRALAAHDAREGDRDDLPGNCKRCERCSNIFVISELYFSNLCSSCIRAVQPQPSVADGWKQACEWVGDHYDDYSDVNGLLQAMLAAAAPQPQEK